MATEKEIAAHIQNDCNESAIKGSLNTSKSEKECTNYSIKSKDAYGMECC